MANTVTMWIETGIITSTTDKCRFVHVHSICAALGSQFCNILPAMQALTGCDSVSSLFSIGKKTVFGVVKKKGADRFKDLCNLGECDTGCDVSSAVFHSNLSKRSK